MERGKRKIRQGVVVGSKMQKTVVVRVERVFRNPLYQKVVRMAKKYLAHDELGQCQVGDLVEIMETRPLSARKHFRVVKVLRRAGS
jgi:small subunit ribosomal protein S17